MDHKVIDFRCRYQVPYTIRRVQEGEFLNSTRVFRSSSCLRLTSYFGVESHADPALEIVGGHGDLPGTAGAVGVSEDFVIPRSWVIIVVIDVVTYVGIL